MQGISAAQGWYLVPADFALSGQFGDSFGPLASVMAAAAALGAWRAVLDQRATIKKAEEQDIELRSETARRDFETTFFNLTGTLDRLVHQIDVGKFYSYKTGKDAFAYFVDEVYRSRSRRESDFSEAYGRVFLKHQNDLAHYLRTLFNIVNFAHRSKAVDGYFYIKLVRATLSEPELVVLALNGLYHEEGRKAFKPLIEQYALLNNISASARADFDLYVLYEPDAFERPEAGPVPVGGKSNAE